MHRELGYAIGPVTKPLFWEVTSVPDIRRQCEALAGLLSARLAPILPSHIEALVASSPAHAVRAGYQADDWQNHPPAQLNPAAADLFLS
jgi:hypothetical protein